MESLFKVSLTSLLTNGMRREHETAVVEKKKKKSKDVSNTVQQVAR